MHFIQNGPFKHPLFMIRSRDIPRFMRRNIDITFGTGASKFKLIVLEILHHHMLTEYVSLIEIRLVYPDRNI